jgi:CheY-like chemotaxis protein
MMVLLVEDDEFKATDLARLLQEHLPTPQVTRAASVTSALRAITSDRFDLIVLDMSLPTFDLSGPGGGGSPQGQGGVEVLRLANRMRAEAQYIVVTQYPDIEIDGSDVPLQQAADRLSKRFALRVRACLPYEFDSDDWQHALTQTLSEFSKADLIPLGAELSNP